VKEFFKPGGAHVCPWWLAYTFDNPLRRVIHPAEKILGRYVSEGMTALDVGCGFGHFAIGMAKLVKGSGRVIALDIQEKMLEKTMARAEKKGLSHIVRPHLAGTSDLNLTEPVDFALAANVLHEMADLPGLVRQTAALLKPGCCFYVMEPAGHVRAGRFAEQIDVCRSAGLIVEERPQVLREHCVLLRRPDREAGK